MATEASTAPVAPTNIYYVSFLVHNPDDITPPELRIARFHQLLEARLPMTLFADDFYRARISVADHPEVHVRPWHLGDLQVARLVASVEVGTGGALILPEHRHMVKDTAFFMTLMLTKAELMVEVVRERQEFAAAAGSASAPPFIGFLDAGIVKIFKDVPGSLERLRTLRLSEEALGGRVMLPGCWQPRPLPLGHLISQICWIFCGGFVVCAAERAAAFFAGQQRALQRILDMRRLTWEVNVWAAMLTDEDHTAPGFAWFEANHDDRMTMVPNTFKTP